MKFTIRLFLSEKSVWICILVRRDRLRFGNCLINIFIVPSHFTIPYYISQSYHNLSLRVIRFNVCCSHRQSHVNFGLMFVVVIEAAAQVACATWAAAHASSSSSSRHASSSSSSNWN